MSNYSKVTLFPISSFTMFELKTSSCSALTPCEYLEKYCRVNNRRHTLYKRVFDKHKDSEGELSSKVRRKESNRWTFFSRIFRIFLMPFLMLICVQLIIILLIKWLNYLIYQPMVKSILHNFKALQHFRNDIFSIFLRE